MIPKSGNRFSDKIMRKQNVKDEIGSTQSEDALVATKRRAPCSALFGKRVELHQPFKERRQIFE
jgi:hypothetical protein